MKSLFILLLTIPTVVCAMEDKDTADQPPSRHEQSQSFWQPDEWEHVSEYTDPIRRDTLKSILYTLVRAKRNIEKFQISGNETQPVLNSLDITIADIWIHLAYLNNPTNRELIDQFIQSYPKQEEEIGQAVTQLEASLTAPSQNSVAALSVLMNSLELAPTE